MIQIQRLEGFYWVALTEGYARAARAFPYPITQPAVHQQVKKLERELDITLFERVGKDRMMLTPAGAHLYAFIAPFFRDLPGVVRKIQGGDYGGRLTIHAEALMLRHLLPGWLKKIQRRRKDIRIDLRDLTEIDLEPLRTGAADLLVAHLPEVDPDIATMRIATVHPFLVLPKDHRLAGRSRLGIADMAEETLVAYPEETVAHQLQLQAIRAHGVQPDQIITTTSADSILGFVESGLGYSLVPSLAASGPKGRGITAIPLTTPRVDYPIVAAWRKDAPENPLLDIALECAPQL